jgi:site-specific DNA-cytosine methylase
VPTLDLFSGIGSNALALIRDCQVVGYCDSDPVCRSFLTRKMATGELDRAVLLSDVSHFRSADLNFRLRLPVFITAGFPCQDASSANPGGKGVMGPRTGLFFQIIRLLDELPSVDMVYLENVPGITFPSKGLDKIVASLRGKGFEMAMTLMGTWKELGAPAERQRWFCVAVRAGRGTRTTKLLRRFASVTPDPPMEWRSASEPVPRISRDDGSGTAAQAARRRHSLLGNSSVPAQTRLAMSQLCTALLAAPTISARSRTRTARVDFTSKFLRDGIVCIDRTGSCCKLPRTWSDMGGRDARLKVNGYSYPCWNVVTRGTRGMHTTPTRRASRMFWHQVYHEAGTGPLTDSSFVNPNFVEFVMGLPRDWTLAAT